MSVKFNPRYVECLPYSRFVLFIDPVASIFVMFIDRVARMFVLFNVMFVMLKTYFFQLLTIDGELLAEIICSRTNVQLMAIQEKYAQGK